MLAISINVESVIAESLSPFDVKKVSSYLSAFVSLLFIGLVATWLYFSIHLDDAIVELQSVTDTVDSFEKSDKALEINEEPEDGYSQKVYRTGIVENNLPVSEVRISPQTVLEGILEEQQSYNGTGIKIESGVIPPYRANLRPRFNLKNNPGATDVPWSELISFLLEDKTDRNPYITDDYTCGEFAEDLHNNAEMNGIRAAWAVIQWEDGSPPHAINAFMTTDKGLVYIDVSGVKEGIARPQNTDSFVKLTVGEAPYTYLLFPDDYTAVQRTKVVKSVEIYW